MCAFSYTRAYFRSRDKNGGHTIRFNVAENPMVHANFMAVCFMQPELLIGEDCGKGDFRPFCCCNLDQMTKYTNLHDLYSLDIHRMCKYKLPRSRFSKVIV